MNIVTVYYLIITGSSAKVFQNRHPLCHFIGYNSKNKNIESDTVWVNKNDSDGGSNKYILKKIKYKYYAKKS